MNRKIKCEDCGNDKFSHYKDNLFCCKDCGQFITLYSHTAEQKLSKLLPCPFCGDQATFITDIDSYVCRQCDVTIHSLIWNTRHQDEKVQELEAKVEELESKVCDSCLEYDDDGTPQTTYGWNENAEEGQVPCSCISESGPYQVLEQKLKDYEAVEAAAKDWYESKTTKGLIKSGEMSWEEVELHEALEKSR